jgi:hypothetical protein
MCFVVDLIDLAYHNQSNDSYTNRWWKIATHNGVMYDSLDGDASVYRCRSLAQYRRALREARHKSILDIQVAETVRSIKGHLVCWPLDFLADDDLSPSLATKALVPVHLWV